MTQDELIKSNQYNITRLAGSTEILFSIIKDLAPFVQGLDKDVYFSIMDRLSSCASGIALARREIERSSSGISYTVEPIGSECPNCGAVTESRFLFFCQKCKDIQANL